MTDRSDSEDSSPENARASRHSILATKYQPTTTRATPDAIRDELRKLSPPSSAEARRALFTLAHALAHVQPYHEREVCAVCLQEGAVAALLELLLGTAVPEADVRIGRRTLVMSHAEAQLHALTCLVNLCYVGAAAQLRVRHGIHPSAMEVLVDLVLAPPPDTFATVDAESLEFYAAAALHNLAADASFARLAATKPGLLDRLQRLAEGAHGETSRCAEGTIDAWRAHHEGRWPPKSQLARRPSAGDLGSFMNSMAKSWRSARKLIPDAT